MSQTVSPAVGEFVASCIGGVLRAIGDAGGGPMPVREARATAAVGTILRLEPRDVPELLAAGQALLFNELAADGARDVLGGHLSAQAKQRMVGHTIAMGRMVMKQLDTLERWRQKKPGTPLFSIEDFLPATRGDDAVPPRPDAPGDRAGEAVRRGDDGSEPDRSAMPRTTEAPAGSDVTTTDRSATSGSAPRQSVSAPAKVAAGPDSGPRIAASGLDPMEEVAPRYRSSPRDGASAIAIEAAMRRGPTPEEDGSWLDQPMVEWVLETPPAGASDCPAGNAGLAKVPPQPSEGGDPLARGPGEEMLVGSVLLAPVITVGNPDQRSPEMVDEDVPRQATG